MSGGEAASGRKGLIELVRALREQRAEYGRFVDEHVRPLFREQKREDPTEFEDSSFLYMRSYDGDLGVRPFSGPVFWRSPDVTLEPVTALGTYTTTLDAGQGYRVRCTVRNRGDLIVPGAKVELFLTDPTIGFDTRYATNLTIGHVPQGWVNAGGSTPVDFVWAVPATEAGHKCLFARVFSFSPLDVPVDDHMLDPRIDRHVAQQNLNIVGAGARYSFHVVHPRDAELVLRFRPLSREEFFALRHPVLAEVTPAAEFPRGGWGRAAQAALAASEGEARFELDADGGLLTARDPEGPDPEERAAVWKEALAVLEAVAAGKTTMAEQRDVLRRFHEVAGDVRRSTFDMVVPDIGLPPGEAVALDLTAVDLALGQGDVVGGVTLVIVGR